MRIASVGGTAGEIVTTWTEYCSSTRWEKQQREKVKVVGSVLPAAFPAEAGAVFVAFRLNTRARRVLCRAKFDGLCAETRVETEEVSREKPS